MAMVRHNTQIAFLLTISGSALLALSNFVLAQSHVTAPTLPRGGVADKLVTVNFRQLVEWEELAPPLVQPKVVPSMPVPVRIPLTPYSSLLNPFSDPLPPSSLPAADRAVVPHLPTLPSPHSGHWKMTTQ